MELSSEIIKASNDAPIEAVGDKIASENQGNFFGLQELYFSNRRLLWYVRDYSSNSFLELDFCSREIDISLELPRGG
jgi:hypothetical protein